MATAIDDGDNDVPVVLRSLGFCRGHYLLRLFERNRWTVVTNSLVNGHSVLPSVAQTSDLPASHLLARSAAAAARRRSCTRRLRQPQPPSHRAHRRRRTSASARRAAAAASAPPPFSWVLAFPLNKAAARSHHLTPKWGLFHVGHPTSPPHPRGNLRTTHGGNPAAPLIPLQQGRPKHKDDGQNSRPVVDHIRRASFLFAPIRTRSRNRPHPPALDQRRPSSCQYGRVGPSSAPSPGP